jgi:hypothetical protein
MGYVVCKGDMRKRERKRILLRSRRRWKYSIGIDLGEIWWEGVDWMHVTQDRDQWRALVNMIMNLRVL